jgi:hypothetical protein
MSKELSNLPPGYIEPREETIDDLRDQCDTLERKIIAYQNFVEQMREGASLLIVDKINALHDIIRAIDNDDWYRALPFQPERGTA